MDSLWQNTSFFLPSSSFPQLCASSELELYIHANHSNMDFAAIVTNVVAAFAHVGGQALDAAQTTAEALLIALTILAALFQTSKLVTVYRSGTQLSGASVLGYDPLYDTRTRTLPASAPTASTTVPLRVGDDYPPIPLSETIRLVFMVRRRLAARQWAGAYICGSSSHSS